MTSTPNEETVEADEGTPQPNPYLEGLSQDPEATE